MLKHNDLPFTVTSDGYLRYPNGHVTTASPEALLLAVLIKEFQSSSRMVDAEAIIASSAQIAQQKDK